MNANMESIAQMAMVNNQIPSDDFESPPPQDGANGTKRKADDGGQAQQRAKRNRYISIACNEANISVPFEQRAETNLKRSVNAAR